MCQNCKGSTRPVLPDARAFAQSIVGSPEGPIQIAASTGLHELLTDPANMATGAAGALTNHGGPVILGGFVFNAYVGAPALDRVDFDAFSQAVTEGGYYISPDGKDTSPSMFLGSASRPSLGANLTDDQIRAFVDGLVPQIPGYIPGRTLVQVILPAGTSVTMQKASSCNDFCGYHWMTSAGNYYAVICDPTCGGCHGSFTPEQARMMVWAHEYAEWRSDPQGNAWFNDTTKMENADECAWNLVQYVLSKDWVVQPLAVNGPGCTEGEYKDPVPVPVPAKSTGLAFLTEPLNTTVGATPSPIQVAATFDDGSVNRGDTGTLVTATVKDEGTGLSYPAQALSGRTANGVITFNGLVFGVAHNRMTWNATAPGLASAKSNEFAVVASVPVPPPVQTYAQGRADMKADMIKAMQALS